VTRRVTARVTRWRKGDMCRHWCVAGLLRAEVKFRRLKGQRAMSELLKALEALVRGVRVESSRLMRGYTWRNRTSTPRAETLLGGRERL
jgi:hypothetical protein